MNKIKLLLIIPLLLASCDKPKKDESSSARYNVQTTSVMGVVMLCQITDNEENMTYVYEMRDTALELNTVIDLSKTGDAIIPLQKTIVNPKIKLASPSIDTTKYFELGAKASQALRKVYAAQRLYLADHPTEPVSSLTDAKLIPHLPYSTTSIPTAQAPDGSILNIKVSVTPPIFVDSKGADHDPSHNKTDGLWDVGR